MFGNPTIRYDSLTLAGNPWNISFNCGTVPVLRQTRRQRRGPGTHVGTREGPAPLILALFELSGAISRPAVGTI